MENFDDYTLPGGLDGLTRAIHNQHTVKDENPEEKEIKNESQEVNEVNEQGALEESKADKKKTASKKEKTESSELQPVNANNMSDIEKVLSYADAYSKEYRGGEKKKGNMIMIDEDLKLSLDKLKLAYSGEMKLSVKHLANAIIKIFFEDEKIKEAIKAQMKKL